MASIKPESGPPTKIGLTRKTKPPEKKDKPQHLFKTRAEIGAHQLQALLPVRPTETKRTETTVQKPKPRTEPRSELEPELQVSGREPKPEPGTQPGSESEPKTGPAPEESETGPGLGQQSVPETEREPPIPSISISMIS